MKAISILVCFVSFHFVYSQTPVSYSINTQTNQVAISPYIYGCSNGGYSNATIVRQGGNRMTGYNWENNASNAGADYFHQSDDYLCSLVGISAPQSNLPAKYTQAIHNSALAINAQSAITIPMAGYVAKDKNGTSVSVAETAPSARWCAIQNIKGSAFSLTPNLSDNFVYTDEYINFLISTYGNSSTANGIKNFLLDNEAAIWNGTHPRIVPSTTNNITNFVNKSIQTAQAIRSMDANVKIWGPESYGFSEYYNFQTATDWPNYSGTYPIFLSNYLDKMKVASTTNGSRLLDVMSVHWYPESNAVSIFSANTDNATVLERLQSPRSFWDPTFVENSYIGQYFSTFLPIIPYLKSQINTYYPGTKFAMTEYDFGADNHFSGGIAEAEALMGFIKTGTDYAFKWNTLSGYSLSAIQLFNSTNYKFGNKAVTSTSNNQPLSNVVASINNTQDAELHIIATNKSLTNTINATFTINSSVPNQYTNGLVYKLESASSNIVTQNLLASQFSGNTFTFTMNPASVNHFVLKNNSLEVVQNQVLDKVTIFPNPVASSFEILNGENIESYSIKDVLGKIIVPKTNFLNQEISLFSKENGLYFITLFDKNGFNKTIKIIKN
jgi:Glycoside hydrolase family 44/Secretion system C-terminal sorting domain